MHLILQRLGNGIHEPGGTAYRRLRKITIAGFMLFFAKGMLWIAAAIWFVV